MSAVAATALTGSASLRFSARSGATVMVESRLEAPLKIVRPFTIADGRLVVPLLTVGPGLCGGDAYSIDLLAEPGARVVLTHTAANRVLGMSSGARATQRIRLHVARGAHVEYYPGLTIPFPDSALEQRVEIDVERGGRVGVLDVWSMGRIARGEYLRFRSLQTRTTLCVDGRLAYADTTLLDTEPMDLSIAGILEGHRYLATGVWYGIDLPDDAPLCEPSSDVIAALGQIEPGLVFLRALGHDAIRLEGVLRAACTVIARSSGVCPVRLDRFRC